MGAPDGGHEDKVEEEYEGDGAGIQGKRMARRMWRSLIPLSLHKNHWKA
jgi:hypothetical protein